jgi:spermidine/putrescine transport system ATP-binding protein
MALLEIKNVSRRFGDFTAVDDVSFTVESGEFFTLLGPSGCGKTTLLRMIAGFDLPDSGAIVLDGVDLRDTPAEQRPIHTVFQSYALFPHMTVAQNIAFPLRMAGKGDDEVRTRVREAVAQVKLDKLEQRYPHELSGGQKQRVALAAALVGRPEVVFLDEPTAGLDPHGRLDVYDLLREVQADGATLVVTTHSFEEAQTLATHLVVLADGRTAAEGTPADVVGSSSLEQVYFALTRKAQS